MLGHRCVEVLAFAQRHHGLDIALADQVRVQNFQPFGQGDALCAGHGIDRFRLGEQHAAGNAASLADGRCLHQQRLGTFGQDDTFVGLLRALDQLIAEHGWRQAHLARRTAALAQPGTVEVAGHEVGDELGTLAVIDRDFPVQGIELVCGVVGPCADRQDRQPGLQRSAAQPQNTRIGLAVAGQQQACQRHAVDGCQAHGKDDVVAIAGRHHQGPGCQQRHGVGHRAGADDDLGHAPLFVVTGIEDLGPEQLCHIARARGVELWLIGNAADQAEVIAAQQRRVLTQARRELLHALVGAHLVQNHAQHLGVARTSEQLGL